MTEDGEDGVQIQFLSKSSLPDSFSTKIDRILEKVRDGNVLVLEEYWGPKEKRELIKRSVQEADEDFPGVEFMGVSSTDKDMSSLKRKILSKIFDIESRGLTVVGDARKVEKIREEKDVLSMVARSDAS
jgi:hypothetical protein